MSKKVFLGVGHGGKDSGVAANGFKESDLNLKIALYVKSELERHGVIVGISRTTDENDPINEEIKECNAFNPNLAVEIHNNAGGGDGAEIFYYSKGGASKTLAENIIKEITSIGQNSRGIKTKLGSDGREFYAWIRETVAPAVLIECAFVDNKEDIKIIDSKEKQEKMGIAIAKGILKELNISYKNAHQAPAKNSNGNTETENKLYRVQVGTFKVKENADRLKNELISKGYNAIVV